MSDLAVLIIGYLARTAVLTLILWIMVKLQKLNYFFLGLLGSAALAAALDTIPYFGHYLAVPVLYLCIWKVTQASLMPDAVFTVAVSYALMFAVKVLLLTALLGDLRTTASDERAAELQTAALPVKPAAPTPVSVVKPDPKTNAPTPAKPAKSADEILKDVTVKGATENGDKSLLVIGANKKIYTLGVGENVAVAMPTAAFHIRLIRVKNNWATVEVNGEAAYVRIR